MTRRILILLAAGGSLALLSGAFAFQYLGGMHPCTLCIWQRWPHAAAILIGVLALWLGGRLGGRVLPVMGAFAAATTAGIALFHTGVEKHWWEGLASCTGGTLQGLSGADLLNPALTIAAPVRCDEVPWEMIGLSMASWNGIASIALMVLWILAAKAR
jgi:disulfide bond formation protein DsbB